MHTAKTPAVNFIISVFSSVVKYLGKKNKSTPIPGFYIQKSGVLLRYTSKLVILTFDDFYSTISPRKVIRSNATALCCLTHFAKSLSFFNITYTST